MREINRKDDIPAQEFREFKDFSGMEAVHRHTVSIGLPAGYGIGVIFSFASNAGIR